MTQRIFFNRFSKGLLKLPLFGNFNYTGDPEIEVSSLVGYMFTITEQQIP